MRVYGSSPLFNYVELVFRSKRLFIVSVILASLATTGFYAMRAKSYSAHMIVLMTGSEGLGAPDDSQRGSVKYKMDVLNILVKDPNFIKQAMRDSQLDRGKTEVEFIEFCKQVNNSLTYGSDGGSIMEISCRWPDRACEQIIKAFYSQYSSIVFQQETIQSTTRARLLDLLVKQYAKKQHDLDLQVKDYQLNKVLFNPQSEFNEANKTWYQINQEVKRVEEQAAAAAKQRDALASALKNTQEKVDESIVYKGSGQSSEYLNAVQAREDAQKRLNELSLKYTASAPLVKTAQEAYDLAKGKVDQITIAAGKQPAKTGLPETIRRNINPQYMALKSLLTDQELTITRIKGDLTHLIAARDEAERQARAAPTAALNFKAMTEDMGLYSSMHASLRADLENARLAEMRDKELKTAEMKVMVQPEAELEKSGGKGALMLAAGPLIGLLIAFAFSLLAESLDHSLRTPLEVEKYLNKPVLAVLPRMASNKRAAQRQLDPGDHRPSLPS